MTARPLRLLVILAVLALPVGAQATTYYLSTSGSNTNPGTLTAPWRTLDRILLKSYSTSPFKPGDSILLKRGDVFDGQVRLKAKGISGSPVVLGAFGEGPAPLIRGDRPSLVWQAVAGFPGVYSAMLGEGTITGAVYEGQTKLKATPANGTTLSKLAAGSWGPSTASNRIYVRTLTGGPATAVRVFGTGIYIEAGSAWVNVQGIDVTRTFTGIDVSGSTSVTVSGCRVSDALAIGFYLRSGDVNCTVDDCETLRTGGDGLYVLGGNGCTFRDNVVSDVSDVVMGLSATLDHCGVGLQQSTDTLVEGNVIRNVLWSGIDYYLDVGSIVRYNLISETPKGIFPHASAAEVYGNLILLPDGAGAGISATSTGGTVGVFDNVIWGAGSYAMLANAAKGPVSVRNNVVYSSSPACRLVIPTGPVDSAGNVLLTLTP